MDANGDVVVTFTRDEALILFEWLASQQESKRLAPLVGDRATVIALQNMLCGLESVMIEPFEADYAELVERAKQRLLSG